VTNFKSELAFHQSRFGTENEVISAYSILTSVAYLYERAKLAFMGCVSCQCLSGSSNLYLGTALIS